MNIDNDIYPDFNFIDFELPDQVGISRVINMRDAPSPPEANNIQTYSPPPSYDDGKMYQYQDNGLLVDPSPFLSCNAEDLCEEEIQELLEQYQKLVYIVYKEKDFTDDSTSEYTFEEESDNNSDFENNTSINSTNDNSKYSLSNEKRSWQKINLPNDKRQASPFLSPSPEKRTFLPKRKSIFKKEKEIETNIDKYSLDNLFNKDIFNTKNCIIPSTPILYVGAVLVRKKNFTTLSTHKQWNSRWLVLVYGSIEKDSRSSTGYFRILENPYSFDSFKDINVSFISQIQEHPRNPNKYPGYCLSLIVEGKITTFSFQNENSYQEWLKNLLRICEILPVQVELE